MSMLRNISPLTAVKPKILHLILTGLFALLQFIPLAVAYFMGIAIKPEYLVLIFFALAAVPLIAMYNGRCGSGVDV